MKHFLLVLLVALSGCQSSHKKVTHFDGQVMTMNYHVIIGKGLSNQEKDHIQMAIDDNFYLVNQIFNRFNPLSELSHLNTLNDGERITLSDELLELLRLTDRMVHLTQGKFDPTVWSVQEIWKEHLANGTIPKFDELEARTHAVGWTKIHIEGQEVWKEDALTQLDLSGIAKGHAIDLLVDKLNQMGYWDVYVEWGGEILVSGQHPEKRPWTIAITPIFDRNPDHALDTVTLVDQGVATSGNYLQYWTVGEETYTHIMDPSEMKPLKRIDGGIASVTVCAPTCAMADALATAAMLFSSMEEAEEWAESLDDVSFWFLNR